MKRTQAHFRLTMPTGILLFGFFFSVYLFTIYGQLRYGDEAERYLQAKSLIDSQTLIIPFIPGEGQTGVGGNAYSQFEMGYGLTVIPFYALGRLVSNYFTFADPDWIPLLFVSLSNPLITALTCVVLFAFARAIGVTFRAAIWSTLIFGLGTIAWPYSKSLDREAIQSLCLLLATYSICRARVFKSRTWLLVSGSSFGFLALSKVANLIMLPVFFGYLAFTFFTDGSEWNSREKWTRLFKSTALFLFPIILCLFFQGIINLIKFGDFSNIGPYNYGNPLPYFSLSTLLGGVSGLLFSPGKSLILYAPPVLLFLPACALFFRRNKVDSIFILTLVVLNILFSGSYFAWQGGSYWGPRYLVELVPLMILPVGMLWEIGAKRTRLFWALVTGVTVAIGIGVQLLAGFTDDREFLDIMGRWIDIPGAFDFFRHGGIHSLAVSLVPHAGLEVSPYGGLLIGLILLCAFLLLVRSSPRNVDTPRVSLRSGAAMLVLVFAIPVGGLVALLVPQYPAPLIAQGNTKYVAAESFYADGRFCEARAFYTEALDFGSAYSRQSANRLNEIAPPAMGAEVDIGELAALSSENDVVKIESDSAVTLFGNGSMKIAAPLGKRVDFEADSPFFSVEGNAQYELSGWIKLEGVAADGSANLGWYEDNGKWRNPGNLDFVRTSGTHGWLPIRQLIRTASTTQRALLKAGLGHSGGTMWIEALRLIQVQPAKQSESPLPCQPLR